MNPDYMHTSYSDHKPAAGTSRLTKKEQKKLLNQTALFLIGAVAFLLAFIFLIIPGVIRLTMAIIGPGTEFADEDTLPPQVPIFSAPPPATYSAQLSLTGYTEAGATLNFLVNGSKQKDMKAQDDGSFEVELDLSKGENQIAAYAVDQANNESASSKTYTVIQDSVPPKIEVTEPSDGQEFSQKKNQVVTIKGITEENARVYINGRLTIAKNTGDFSMRYQLQEGENKIKIESLDTATNKADIEIILYFKP